MGKYGDGDGSTSGAKGNWIEPRYDHPEYQKALAELNRLLADRFDGNPLIEFVDVMHIGFWGEGHFGGYPSPFPDAADGAAHAQPDGSHAVGHMEEDSAGHEHAAGHQQYRQPRSTLKSRCAEAPGSAPTASSSKNRFKLKSWPIALPGWRQFSKTDTSASTTSPSSPWMRPE